MNIDDISVKFGPAVQEIVDMCRISDSMFDKDLFRIYIATIWGNAVVSPDRSGIEESDLEILHDYLNTELQSLLTKESTISSCYEFIVSKQGDDSMTRLRLPGQHKEFLLYMARLILESN